MPLRASAEEVSMDKIGTRVVNEEINKTFSTTSLLV